MAVFNREDGKLALGSKTPVSILQEHLQKKGLIPQYELIFNGVGMIEPVFKFRVSADGQTAIGDGKTKKEAKHDAAASLLRRLLNDTTAQAAEEIDIASPYTGALKTNYVGMLEEICFLNKIPPAIFEMVLEEGPPHARVFTMKCVLSSISETAVARTKKQAKHLVAQKMIERVKRIFGDKFIAGYDNDEGSDEIVTDQEKIRNGTFRHDLTYKVDELHNVFHILKEDQPLPAIFKQLPDKPVKFYEDMEGPVAFLEEIVDSLEGVVEKHIITKEEYLTSVAELRDLLEDDGFSSESEDIIEADEEDTQSTTNGVETIWTLPDFPLSDDEEIIENVISDKTEIPKCENAISDRLVASEDYSIVSTIKVEVTRGRWEFVGRGKTDDEAVEQAARRALIFLRLLAIPPPAQ